MNPSTAQLFIDKRCAHGEGPVWDPESGILYWVDITACRLHTWDSFGSEVRNFQFSEPVCAVTPLPSGRLLVAFAKRLAYLNLDGSSCEEICKVESYLPGNRCNDGKLDPAGRFWIGTMSSEGTEVGSGSLYRLDDGGRLTPVLGNLTIPNGMGWSSDHQTMYFIDSPTRQIRAFAFDLDDSSISLPRIVVEIPQSLGMPDGMAVAADGTLWVAHWGSGCICRWSPSTGALLERVNTGCPHTSSCCVTPDGKIFITTSRLGLNEAALQRAPLSGSLFIHHQTDKNYDH